MRLVALIWLIIASSIASSAWAESVDWNAAHTVDLSDIDAQSETLPLLLEPTFGLQMYRPQDTPHTLSSRSFLVADMDGDGRDEYMRATHKYMALIRFGPSGTRAVTDQFNFPLEYHSTDDPMEACCTLEGPFDLDGDGQLEVVAWAKNTEGTGWGFWVISVPEFQQKNHFTLGTYPERKFDGQWDGKYHVVGSLPGLLADPSQEALVVAVTVGFDVNGRGVMAVDPMTGEILWHYQAGPKFNIVCGSRVADLDGDGHQEIIYLGTGVGNLAEGEALGKYGDHETRLFVLNRYGEELWSRQVAAGMSNGFMQVGHFTGQSDLEICVSASTNNPNVSHLNLFDGSGQTLIQQELPVPGEMIHAIGRSDSPLQDILLTSFSGSLCKIRLEGSKYRVLNEALFNGYPRVTMLPEFKPNEFKPFMVSDRTTGSQMMLDEDFNVLACFPQYSRDSFHFFVPLQNGSFRYLLRQGLDNQMGLAITENPNALPTQPVLRLLATMPRWGWALLVLTLLTLISWWQLARKHKEIQQAVPAIPVDGDHKREAQLHLLEDLELSGHGAIAPLRSFRRLLWLLDAVKTGIEFNSDISLRFREIWADCHQDDIPRLLVILDRARAAQLEHASIGPASEALLLIQAELAAIKASEFDLVRIKESSEPLHTQGKLAEESLQELREEVGQLFQADLAKAIEKVLRANDDNLKANRVQVQRGQAMAAAGGANDSDSTTAADPLLCRIDANELGFIVDNLVGNAVRAMSSATERQLGLTWQAVNGMVKLEVSDTGIGIVDEDRDRIMDTPFTTRKRGGMGLPRSQRILRKYGGQLAIKESSPGGGTTFQLLLPRIEL